MDTERNFLDILDQLRLEDVDQTHMFTLSQAYEGLQLQMGEKNNDGGLFAGAPAAFDVVLTVDPQGPLMDSARESVILPRRLGELAGQRNHKVLLCRIQLQHLRRWR